MSAYWTDMYLTFIPPEECDWLQIRNFEIYYKDYNNGLKIGYLKILD